MINEEDISVTAKKDYVLLRATDWKTSGWFPALPELRGWLCSAWEKTGREDICRTEEGGRIAGEGDSAGEKRRVCRQLLSAPGSWLPEGCSPSSPHRKLDPGSAHWEQLEPGREMFLLQAIMQSDK